MRGVLAFTGWASGCLGWILVVGSMLSSARAEAQPPPPSDCGACDCSATTACAGAVGFDCKGCVCHGMMGVYVCQDT